MPRQIVYLWGFVAAATLALSPLASSIASSLPACRFKSLTGYACPSCGTSRAALALAELDFVHAFQHYPLPTLGWVFFLGGGLVGSVFVFLGGTLPDFPKRIPLSAKLIVVGAVLANWAFSLATGV